jgi:glutamate dehydrogenase
MFDLPRSSWQDYDKSKLSAGGVIILAHQKSVDADAAGGWRRSASTRRPATPTEIMTPS